MNPPRDQPNASRRPRPTWSGGGSLSFAAAPCDRPGRRSDLLDHDSERDGEPLRAHITRRGLRRTGGVVMRPDHRRVDRHQPLGVIAVTATLQPAQDPIPGPISRPGAVPAVHGLPRPVRLGQITPRRARANPPQDAVHHPTMRRPRSRRTPALPVAQTGASCISCSPPPTWPTSSTALSHRSGHRGRGHRSGPPPSSPLTPARPTPTCWRPISSLGCRRGVRPRWGR